MKYRLFILLTIVLCLFSPALADTEEENNEVQVVIENQILSYGMTGEEVVKLQQKLAELA